jgi:hypothetical protein
MCPSCVLSFCLWVCWGNQDLWFEYPGTMHDSLLADFIIKSSQKVPAGDHLVVRKARDATQIRQSSVWGIGGFQDSFPRTQNDIPLETHGERHLILKLCVYLFNYMMNVVGCNQICSEVRLLNAQSMFTRRRH